MPRLVAIEMVGRARSSRARCSRRYGGPAKGDALPAQIDVLRSRQNEQGGFGLWTATPDSEPFVSAYAMHFLLEARDRGVAVPKDMIDAGNNYLQLLARRGQRDTRCAGLRQRAYAVYLLTRQGNVTTNDLAAVQKRLQDAYPNSLEERSGGRLAGRVLQDAASRTSRRTS